MPSLNFLYPSVLTGRRPLSLHLTQSITRRSVITHARRPIKATVASPPPPPTSAPTKHALPAKKSSPPPSPPPPTWDYAWPRLLVLLVAAIWGTNFATVKLLQSGSDPVSLPIAAAVRFTLSSLVLVPLAFHEQRKARATFATYAAGIGVGLCITGGYIAQSVSLVSTTASKSAFLCSLAVVVVPVLERILHKFKLRPPLKKDTPFITWGTPALAVAGVALLELSGVTSPTIGDAYALLQAFFFAGGFIGNASATTKHPDLIVTLSVVQLGTVALSSILWAFFHACTDAGSFALTIPDFSTAFSTPANTTAVIYAGVVTTALTVWLQNSVWKSVSVAEVAILLSTEPFWAAAFSAVTLGERFGLQTITGGMLILAACLLNQMKNIKSERLFKFKGKLVAEIVSVIPFVRLLLGDDRSPPMS